MLSLAALAGGLVVLIRGPVLPKTVGRIIEGAVPRGTGFREPFPGGPGDGGCIVPHMKPPRNLRERLFERALWATRLVVILAVMAIVVLAFGAFYYALVDLTYLLGLLADYASLAPSERSAARDEGVTTIVKSLDGFFVGALLLIVAFGLYELFVGRIEDAESSEVGARLLKITSLEDLKERVGKLVVLILAVEFFQRALRLSYESALEILYLAAAILLVSGGLYSIGRRSP